MAFTKEQEQYFNEMIEVLNKSNALDNVILIGSWAEFIYEKEHVIDGFNSLAKTTDIDFLLNDEKHNNSESIIKPAKEKGFLYQEDYITGISKFRKGEFEVEFLISQRGDGTKPIPKYMGINAQQLTHIGFVKDN